MKAKCEKVVIVKRWISFVLSMLFVVLCACGGTTVRAASTGSCHWYCVRAKNHKQPIADGPLRMVEKHGGYYIDHTHSDPMSDDKVVYLTFDAGYENGNVAKVLDSMKEEGVTGAFFILGHLAEACPDLVRRMADEGHLVCNHTYGHGNLVGKSADDVAAELKRMEDACLTHTGVTMAKYFRPPEGTFDESLLTTVCGLGYRTVFWSFAYADWDNGKQPDPAMAKRKILDNIHNGAVILLHPTSATNATVLRDVIRELKAQGYRFGTLDELTSVSSAPSVRSMEAGRRWA